MGALAAAGCDSGARRRSAVRMRCARRHVRGRADEPQYEYERQTPRTTRAPHRCTLLVEGYTNDELEALAAARNAGVEIDDYLTEIAKCANAGFR